jgi:iron complex outermembrane receptor protein
MRACLIVSLCLCTISLCLADPAHAAMRKDTTIPAEGLGPALQSLANIFEFQILYPTQLVKDLNTQGVSGSLTSDEALKKVLNGTGLTYKFLDSNTITVYSASSAPSGASAASGSDSQTTSDATSESSAGGGKKSSQDFRVAQVDQGKGSQSSALGNQANSQENSRSPSVGLEEIVVTAQKREERLQDVPISISVLSGERLDKSNFQGVTEALTTVPGVAAFPWSQGGGTFIAIRGVTASYPIGTGSSPIGYYLDGVPFGLVDTAIAPDANPYDLQRVEVLRGPQGTLYGASALNGVVRVLTNDADLNSFDLKAHGSDSGTHTGGNNYEGDMAINAPLVPGVLGMRAVVGYQSFSGWIDKPQANQNDANDAILRNARLKFNAQPTENLTIGLSAWISRQDYGAPSLSNDEGVSNHIGAEPISIDYGAYGLKVGYTFPLFSVTSTTSYLHYDEQDRSDILYDFFGAHLPLSERFSAHVFSEEVNLNSSGTGPWRWSAGAIYRDGENPTFQNIPGILTVDWTNDSKSYAVFGEISRRFWDNKLEWTLGGRYFHDRVSTDEDHAIAPLNGVDYYSAQESFNSTTPRAVLTWYPERDATIYASYSQGFRSGMPQPYYVTGGVAGFPAVKPDKLHNYELGAKLAPWDERLSIDVAVYYMDWKDVQQQIIVPFGVATVTALINGQSASGPGVDIGLKGRPIEGLELGLDFSWNDLVVDSDVISSGQVLFKKGDRLNFSAKYTAGASAAYTFPLGTSGYRGRFSASANYTSPLDDSAIVGGAERTVIGDRLILARAGFSVRFPQHLEIALFGDNLSNESGAVARNPNATIPDPSSNIRLRPRTIGLQFDYRYQ